MALSTRRPEPINALTGLRFVAAFSVLVAHAAGWLIPFAPGTSFIDFCTRGSAIGMPLFFVLSGFVIHYNYGANFLKGFVSPTIDFFIARFARLYPLYFFCLVAYLIHHGSLLNIFAGADASYLPRYLLLWQAWTIEYRGTTWFGHLALPPAWSISVEVFFYAVYPCLALGLQNIITVKNVFILWLIIVIGYYLSIYLCFVHFDALRVWGNVTFTINADPQNALLGWMFNTGPIGRFWEFLMGALVAQAYLLLRDIQLNTFERKLGAAVLMTTVGAIIGFYVLGSYNSLVAFSQNYAGGFAPIFSILIFSCTRYSSYITTVLSSRCMCALGNASYSIYLIHLFTLFLFRHPQEVIHSVSIKEVIYWIIVMAVAIGFTLIVALGTYRALEVPARSYLRRTLHSIKERLPISRLHWQGPAWLAPLLTIILIGGAVGAANLPLP
jgi:peptidoglycan/LPS O-acetylase OafA/YrhL